jgi:uncharacterized protein
MQPRTERFEMRLDQSILDSIDAWRAAQGPGISRAEAVRTLIGLGLHSAQPSFTDGDRLVLLMLRDLMKHFHVRGEINPDLVAEAIWGGHLWGLEWEYDGLFHSHKDRRSTVREVVDILEMWTLIENSFGKLSQKDKQHVEKDGNEHVGFIGFDGNYETEYLSVARFLIEQLNRFANFKGRELNSHFPVLDRYHRMLDEFYPIRKSLTGRDLTGVELIKVLKVQRS